MNVLYGTLFSGLTSLNNQIWSQDSPGIDGMAEQSDAFGFPLTAGDFDGDGRDDLAIGVTGQDVGGIDNAGAVHVLYGLPSFGLNQVGDQIWTQAALQTAAVAEANDLFGWALPN